MIHIDLRKNSDYFPIQHQMAVFYKRDESVYCAVRTAFLHRIQFTFALKDICIYFMVSLLYKFQKSVNFSNAMYLLGYESMFSGSRLATFRIKHSDPRLSNNLPDYTVSSRSRRQQIFETKVLIPLGLHEFLCLREFNQTCQKLKLANFIHVPTSSTYGVLQ